MFDMLVARVMVTSLPARATNWRMSCLGFGVVVATMRGFLPRRRANMIICQASSSYVHAASSSAQTRCHWPPRKRSGSEAGMPLISEPLISTISDSERL